MGTMPRGDVGEADETQFYEDLKQTSQNTAPEGVVQRDKIRVASACSFGRKRGVLKRWDCLKVSNYSSNDEGEQNIETGLPLERTGS